MTYTPFFATSRKLLSPVLVGVLAIGALAMTASAHADAVLQAALTGASEVPPVKTAGTGSVEATLNANTHLLSWTVTYAGLTGPATAAHFHGPAMPGQNAAVLVPLAGKMTSPMSGSATLTGAQVADLMAGKWYFNVHTSDNPGGEIRGQVTVRP